MNANKYSIWLMCILSILLLTVAGSMLIYASAEKNNGSMETSSSQAQIITTETMGMFPEPESRPEGLREDAYWDSELGMYINGNYTKSENGNFILKSNNSNTEQAVDYNTSWFVEVYDPNNPIDQAIILSIKLSNSELEESFLSSVTPQSSSGIRQAMNTIPIEFYPELWERCCTEVAFRAQKLTGIEQFLDIALHYGLYDLWAQDNLWKPDFLERKNGVPERELTKADYERYGNLLLPGLRDKLRKGFLTEGEWSLLKEMIANINQQFAFQEAAPSSEQEALEWMEKHHDLTTAIQRTIESDYEWVNSSY